MALRLIIGNKTYSSWSFRPWIAMTVADIPFEETVISLRDPAFAETVGEWSGTGKVPVLIDGDFPVWESLSILEYLAEKFPDAGLWPADPMARAHARTVSAEMHAGFAPLRKHLPFLITRPVKPRDLTDEAAAGVTADVARIEALWADCRARFGAPSGAGPFLFGAFSAADAMYAPVVARFYVYDVPVSAATRDYMDAVMVLPAWAAWKRAARDEPWVLDDADHEPDWPEILREPKHT
ncbi:Glutathione S-transferase [Rhodovulum sp. PH10]|uniref:glutathione S-transferase family protein n=1 Tax=Rhodovulum sp. PH10 TaxID=1187851 RepID=UPI00027C2AB4|nr:glutathione S-transferase family protein [Rhodovulum sp. PH10]EJW10087.1 Glutathione S-transferase [Rhodovulum sp. PH10]